MTPASTPPPEHNDEQIPDVRNPAAMREYIDDLVRNPAAMREYIDDLSRRIKRDRHQVGPVKARMMEKRLKKLKRQYGVMA